MGLNPALLQPQQQPGGIDQLAQNAMFPQSQMDKTQYATPSQMPTSAEVVDSDYDAQTNAYSGMPTKPFASGGIAALRYDDGGEVDPNAWQPVNYNPDPNNPDSAGTIYFKDPKSGHLYSDDTGSGKLIATSDAINNADVKGLDLDPVKAQQLYDLKQKDPKQYADQVIGQLGTLMKNQYNNNQNYDQSWKQFANLQSSDPAAWQKANLDWLGHHQGWQIGQNRSDRNAAEQPAIQNAIKDALAAGLSQDEINQILSGSQQTGSYQNQVRIANAANAGGPGVFSGFDKAAPMFASVAAMALAPELAPLLAPELGAFGGAMASGAITGGAVGGIGAAANGGDIGKGVLMGGTTGAVGAGVGAGLNGIDPNIGTAFKGINTAKNIYNVAQSNGQNIGADINAFKGIANMAPTMSAAHGGLMSGGGIANLGSYSDGGQLLKGPGDGMSDNIPAKIGQHQPARLADGEFVIPADVVSHLGNGSTDAGAKQLYKMMDKIRRARTGNPKQGKRINPEKFTLKG